MHLSFSALVENKSIEISSALVVTSDDWFQAILSSLSGLYRTTSRPISTAYIHAQTRISARQVKNVFTDRVKSMLIALRGRFPLARGLHPRVPQPRERPQAAQATSSGPSDLSGPSDPEVEFSTFREAGTYRVTVYRVPDYRVPDYSHHTRGRRQPEQPCPEQCHGPQAANLLGPSTKSLVRTSRGPVHFPPSLWTAPSYFTLIASWSKIHHDMKEQTNKFGILSALGATAPTMKLICLE